MNTTNQILIAAQARLAELENEAEHLRALIDLYRGKAAPERVLPEAKGRGRGISAAWKPFGAYAAERGEAHLDELTAFSEENGLGFDRTQIRNQFHNWKRRGFVESPRQSMFVVTPAGIAEFGLRTARNSNGAGHEPAPSPEIENSAEPRSPENARFDLLNHNKAGDPPGGGT